MKREPDYVVDWTCVAIAVGEKERLGNVDELAEVGGQ